MAETMLAARDRSCEKVDENRRVSHTLKPGCEVTNEPVEAIVDRLKTLADDERLAKTPVATDEQVAFAMGRLSCCDF